MSGTGAVPNAVAARQALFSDGYVVLRGLLEPAEVRSLRRVVIRHLKRDGLHKMLGTVDPLAWLDMPEIRWLFTDERIVGPVGELLGVESPVFTLHCDAYRNSLSIWHKDSGETVTPGGYLGEGAYGLEGCPVVKLALYLQDHGPDDAGLHVRPGSHKEEDIDTSGAVGLETKAGDIVVFDIRISHMGEPRHRYQKYAELRWLSRLPEGLRGRATDAFRATDLRLKRRPDRISLFFSYGVGGSLTDRFAKTNLTRAFEQAGKPGAELPAQVLRELEQAGATLANLAT